MIIGTGEMNLDLPIFATLLIVQNDVDGDPRSTRPLGIGIFAFITLEVSISSTERDILLNALFQCIHAVHGAQVVGFSKLDVLQIFIERRSGMTHLGKIWR
jgi:hypothetical protein